MALSLPWSSFYFALRLLEPLTNNKAIREEVGMDLCLSTFPWKRARGLSRVNNCTTLFRLHKECDNSQISSLIPKMLFNLAYRCFSEANYAYYIKLVNLFYNILKNKNAEPFFNPTCTCILHCFSASQLITNYSFVSHLKTEAPSFWL